MCLCSVYMCLSCWVDYCLKFAWQCDRIKKFHNHRPRLGTRQSYPYLILHNCSNIYLTSSERLNTYTNISNTTAYVQKCSKIFFVWNVSHIDHNIQIYELTINNVVGDLIICILCKYGWYFIANYGKPFVSIQTFLLTVWFDHWSNSKINSFMPHTTATTEFLSEKFRFFFYSSG